MVETVDFVIYLFGVVCGILGTIIWAVLQAENKK